MKSNLIGTFDTVAMIGALDATPRPRTFLRDRLFGGRFTSFETQHVAADFKKGKRSMAPFVNRNIGGKLVEAMSWATQLYTPPMVAPRAIFRGDEALGRAYGEVIGGSMSPDERAAAAVARRLDEHDWLITRREEWMLAKMLATGTIVIAGEGVSDEINLNFTNTDTLAGNNVWGGTTSKPVENIRYWKRVVLQQSGVTPDTMVLGADASDAFLEDTHVQALLDKKNAMVGQVNLADLPNGVEYIGNIAGVDIFCYPEWYIDDSTGLETAIIPTDKAILFPSAARNPGAQMLYGAYYDVEDEATYVGSRIPRSWTDKDKNARYIEVVTFPVPFMPDADSWLVATVI